MTYAYSMPLRRRVKRRKPPRPRDSQKRKVYAAENVLKGRMPLDDIDAAAKLVGKLLNAAVFKHRYDLRLEHSPVHVGLTRRDSGHSWGSVKGIRLHPIWGLDAYIVCHEMAHVVALRIYGRENIAAHGWQWAEIYLILVLAGMGRQAHDDLKASFKAAGIRFTKPRQGRVLTQEQRKVLAERLERARNMRIVGSGLTTAPAVVESEYRKETT